LKKLQIKEQTTQYLKEKERTTIYKPLVAKRLSRKPRIILCCFI